MNGVYFIFIIELPSKSGMNDEGLNTANLDDDDDDEQDSDITEPDPRGVGLHHVAHQVGFWSPYLTLAPQGTHLL
jgi:hypothetical protein